MQSTIGRVKKAPKPRFSAIGNKEGLVSRVVQAIEHQILSGRLQVGSRLPPEREFAESLSVSRTVVREAVRTLVTRGLLETRHGIGTMVRAVTQDEVTRPLTLFLRTCGQEVNLAHLHQVRTLLEIENAGIAAEQRTEEDVKELSRLCDEMQAAYEMPEQFAAKDSEFHRRLSQTTHNPLMILLLDSVQALTAEIRNMVRSRPDLFDRVMPTHLLILQSVAARDSKGARAAMRQHLEIAFAIQREMIEAGSITEPLKVGSTVS
jgi:GntR family transcriptional repressor for pyruvate dehydrogenase complex